ncbi:restriction endonuclease subunit S [Rhodoferax sp.]|uniref:restriction endonuclease subunit S n=1 Tax=Rhodoferax sp. TaxID=50421 RepID=UPI0028507BE6|nr:restriction endonuclease subunit S [Rhodoferax sp.]MDR3367988.1 restriction endonuclease subunit S [Rhodoferax sp.]
MLLSNLDLLATAPGGVVRLRELILTLAVQGKLVPQDPNDEPASELLKKIQAEKSRLDAEGKIARVKPVAGLADAKEPFELPSAWLWAQLGEITNYGATSKASAIQPETWVLDMEDIEKSSGRLIQRFRFAERPAISDKNRFTKGDVLYGKLRPYLNKVMVADEDGVCTTEIIPFRCYGPYVPQYFKIVLSSPCFLDYVNVRSYGMKMPRLGTEDARAAPIPLPPLVEQSRIVARVEELMRLCDALEVKDRLEATQHAKLVRALLGTLTDSSMPEELAENWQRIAAHFDLLLDRPEAIDALEQTIIQLAVRGLLSTQSPGDVPVSIGDREKSISAIPATWSRIALEDVLLELRYGTSVKCGYEVNGKPVLRIPNIKGGAVDTADLKFGVLDEREMVKLCLEKGDILVIRSNGSASLVGSVAIVDAESEGFAFAGYLMRLRLKREFIEPSYLILVMQTLEIRSQIETPIRTTSGVKNINSTEVSRLAFSLPPLAEQSRILLQVAFLRRRCTDLRQQLASARQRQSQLAQALVEQQSVATI